MRIVVTGIGTVSPYGVGANKFWASLINGKSAVRQMEVEAFQKWSPAAAEIVDFDPKQFLARKLVNDTDRVTQISLVAATEAMKDAGFEPDSTTPFRMVESERVGIAFGTAFGGIQTLEAGAIQIATNQSGRTSPRLVSKSILNAPAGAMAIRWGIQGPVLTYSTACASSANSIGEASFWLKSGQVDVVLAGGAESLFTPSLLAGLSAAGAIAKSGPSDYSQWSRPFDRDRQGMVMGEGAAILVLETLEHAVSRGARIYAELQGYGTSNDAHHETAPHPDGKGAALAMERAIRNANMSKTDIEYVNAHATSTPAGDAAEGKALLSVFGDRLANIPVSSIKGAVGHMLGAAGAIESIASILAIRDEILPATLHVDNLDPTAPPDVIPHHARRQRVNSILSNSFGFGGQNASLLWTRYQEGGDEKSGS